MNRDSISEGGGWNLYCFLNNRVLWDNGYRGISCTKEKCCSRITAIVSNLAMKFICIVFLFATFFVIANGKMTDRVYQEFDLYTEASFFKDGKNFQVTQLSQKQRNELKDILSKYNLFVEGKTENTYPFIGPLAMFHVTIDKKPYLLCMINNTNHIFAEKKIGREEYQKKLFWILEADGNRYETRRIFELAALYLELEKFLERAASPVMGKD